MRFDGILFDKDGTLFDFGASWAAWAERLIRDWAGADAQLAGAMARAVDFDLAARAFAPDSVIVAGTPQDAAARLEPVVNMPRAAIVARLNAAAETAPMIPAVPLAPLLDRLRALGLRLGVATNDGVAPARAHLAAAGVLDRFDYLAGFDSGHGAKPEPGMCLAFADEMHLDPARVLMVGDSLHDLRAGRAAGMATLAVLTGLAGAGTLSPFADAVLPDIGHLPAWITGAGA